MLERRVIEEVRNCWIADQNHPHRGRRQQLIPELRDFEALMRTAMAASLGREEGRHATFALVLLREEDRDREQMNSGSRQEIVTFESKLPLTEQVLQKVSPLCNPRATALAVSPPAGAGDEYQIWGLTFFGEQSGFLDQVAVGVGYQTFRPDVLMVTGVAEASLVISRGGGEIGRVIRGKFYPAIPTPLLSSTMGGHILSSIRNLEGYRKQGVSYWHVYSEALTYLVSVAGTRGHGGTVILIPPEHFGRLKEWMRIRYRLLGTLGTSELMQHAAEAAFSGSSNVLGSIAYNRELAERLRCVGHLAGADGALILTHDLEPMACGVTLVAPPWQGRVIVGPDGFGGGGEDFPLLTFGTRHNSAADFVGATAECFGFVLSADGPIRGFVRTDERTLCCWPDFSVSMFV